MAAKENDKKTMDVAKPGKPAPDTSGRPVLVTHRPIVQDPMVNQAASTDGLETDAPKKDIVSHSTKTLQPMDTELKRDEKKDSKTSEDEHGSEAAVVDAVAEQAEPKAKLREGELSPEDKAKQEHIQKLITDKKYFVPVGQIARRRNQRTTVVLLVLLVFVVGAYLAVDAGVIKTDIKLPIDLIKN